MKFLIANESVPATYKLGIAEGGRTIVVKVLKNRWSSVERYIKQHHGTLRLSVDYEQDPNWAVVDFPLSSSTDDQMQTITSLDRLLDILHVIMFAEPSDSEFKQSATGSIFYASERRCFGISAVLCDNMSAWIENGLAKKSELPTVDFMKNALKCAHPNNHTLFASDIRVKLPRDGRVSIHVWGDACDLSAYDPHDHQFGTELHCHKVDTPTQAITLMVGLAGLCAEFEKTNPPL